MRLIDAFLRRWTTALHTLTGDTTTGADHRTERLTLALPAATTTVIDLTA